MGSTCFATPAKKPIQPASKSVKSTPRQVVIKMSATRELLSDRDNIGIGRGQSGHSHVIVEMAPHPVTIVINEK
jgi:hypothetical protein